MNTMDWVRSRNNVKIRLTSERWNHIIESHSEMAGYYYHVLECIEEAEIIYEGRSEELIALMEIETNKYIAVVYKEVSDKDGFVITAFITTKKEKLGRRKIAWQSEK